MEYWYTRLLIAHNRLTSATGLAIAQVHGKSQMIPGTPACFLTFEGSIHMEVLDDVVAQQKAAAQPDPKRWFEMISIRQSYQVTVSPGVRFVYVISAGDGWLSFLFLDPQEAV